MRMVLMLALVAFSAPVCAADNNGQAAPVSVDGGQQATQTAKSDDSADRKICKRVQATESRLGAKKLCLTAKQWKDREDEEAASY